MHPSIALPLQIRKSSSLSKHIYLTGYRGTGKTSVGSIVAQTLGWAMIDLDDLVEKNAGRSIREIFAEEGEAVFRELESQALFGLSPPAPVVVSLGGGAILREENRSWIRQHGFCVWLDASPETLARRILSDASTEARRPALTNLDGLDEIKTVLERRRPLYEQVSDARIETEGKTIPEVAAEVISLRPKSDSENRGE